MTDDSPAVINRPLFRAWCAVRSRIAAINPTELHQHLLITVTDDSKLETGHLFLPPQLQRFVLYCSVKRWRRSNVDRFPFSGMQTMIAYIHGPIRFSSCVQALSSQDARLEGQKWPPMTQVWTKPKYTRIIGGTVQPHWSTQQPVETELGDNNDTTREL